MTSRSRIFYGWWVVAASFVTTLVGFGCAYTFSSFLAPLEQEFSATRGAISLVFSLAGFLYFALGALTGPLADRFGVRPLCLLGTALLAAGMAGAASARTLREVFIAYGVGVGLGVGCAYVPAVGAVQRWFSRRRGLASGIAVSGIGVGTLVMPPIASALIGALGWRHAYLVLAGVALVLGTGAALLLRDDPRSMGLTPDGDDHGAGAAPVSEGMTVAQAAWSKPFLLLYASSFLTALGAFVPFVHLVPFAVGHGASTQRAVWLLATIGIGSTLGRLGLGGLADRLGRVSSLVGMSAGMGLALALWSAATSFPVLIAFAASFGVAYGGWVALLPALAADLFGRRHVSGIIGALYTSAALGALGGPAAAGFIFDWTGSYRPAILGSAAAALAGALLMVPSARASIRRAAAAAGGHAS
jgi:MFS family permease